MDFSIIIPVYNDEKELGKTLRALSNQDFTGSYEVIVVDNGSVDGTVNLARSFNEVSIYKEVNFLNSPYSSRNRGIERAKGDIFVFLDSTCTPQEDWLSKTFLSFQKHNCELIGSNVKFRFRQQKPSYGEIIDATINIRMKDSIARGVAKTASLFVKREVIQAIGMFPEGVRSGGDVLWTGKATASGYVLIYEPDSVVYKQARPLVDLIKKQFRVGKGKSKIPPYRSFFKLLGNLVLPPRMVTTREFVEKANEYNRTTNVVVFFFLFWLIKDVQLTGEIYGRIK